MAAIKLKTDLTAPSIRPINRESAPDISIAVASRKAMIITRSADAMLSSAPLNKRNKILARRFA